MSRIAIVGTGFSGLGMAIKLKQQGHDDFVILERASDLGGTWRDNSYPGCACDVPSHLYSFSFALNPHWSHVFSPQPEILAYLRRCAEDYGILPYVRWNTELTEARWDDMTQLWHLETNQGPLSANFVIMGQGPLSEPSLPQIPGLDRFAGTLFHSAQWNHEHDLRGERVAIVGTGASSIQITPQIQPLVEHLTLFQRTPPWILPRNDHPISPWKQALYQAWPITQRLARGTVYVQREIAALGMVYRTNLLAGAERQALKHLHQQIQDPALRAKLTPNYRLGCKRVLPSDDFYPALTQPNVALVTDQIREVREHAIVTADGTEHLVDAIICATGFHVTDWPTASRIHGHSGQSLKAAWQDGLQAYLGTSVAGFPNLFLLIGPNTGLGHNSMVYMIESQLTYLLDMFATMQQQGMQTVEVLPGVQTAYNQQIQERLKTTVWASGCRSWYLDAHGHNTTIWPGFTFAFRRRTRHFDAASYALAPAKVGAAAVGLQSHAE